MTTEKTASPDQIEREIDQTRREISHTIDALTEKLSPGQLLDQALGYVKEGGGAFVGNLGRSVRDNPVPVTLLGVGLAWLMMSGRSHPESRNGNGYRYAEGGGYPAMRENRGSVDYAGERIDTDEFDPVSGGPVDTAGSAYRDSVYRSQSGVSGDRSDNGAQDDEGLIGRAETWAGEARDAAGRRLHEAGDSLRDAAADLRERVSHARHHVAAGVSGMRDRGADYVHDAGRRLSRAGEATGTFMRDNPLVVVAAALAVGGAIAAMIPTSRRERELMGGPSDALRDSAAKAASELKEKVRHTAEAAVDAAATEAGRQGLTGERGAEAPGTPAP